MRIVSACLALLTALAPAAPATGQEAARFGAWRAFCAPVAGCVLGVKSGEGDTLAFVEPPSGDDRLLLFLSEPVQDGARIVVSIDGRVIVTLGPADGWRRIDSAVGPAIQIAPSIAREGLMEPMRRRDRMRISYPTPENGRRQVTFSLNGYADIRGYADEE